MTDELRKKRDELLQGKTVKTSISFGQKDGFLLHWVQTLPWGVFSNIIRSTITAYLNNDMTYTIPEFPSIETEFKDQVTKSINIYKEDYDIYEYITSIPKYNRAHEIKQVLRLYLNPEDGGVPSSKSIQFKQNKKLMQREQANIPKNKPQNIHSQTSRRTYEAEKEEEFFRNSILGKLKEYNKK